MLSFAKAKYTFTGMDPGDLRFDKDEVFLITKKEGGWWWGMKEEGADTDEASRIVRIMTPSDQGRFPKNYVAEISQEEYVRLKTEQDETRQKRKQEEAERRRKQEELWNRKQEKIREEEEKRKRQERTQLKLQKVFGSEGDILLLSPRSQKEARLDALSPRRREKLEKDKEKEREKSGKSKTSSGDNRELKSSVEKRAKAFNVVREERANSTDGQQALARAAVSPLSTMAPSRSSEDVSSQVEPSSTPPANATRKWIKKKKSLPRSLERLASDYQERKNFVSSSLRTEGEEGEGEGEGRAEDQGAQLAGSEEGEGAADSTSSSDTNASYDDTAPEEEDTSAGEVAMTRRRQLTASTMFMNDMNYLAPELAKRAEEAKRKRRGRNAVSLDRA